MKFEKTLLFKILFSIFIFVIFFDKAIIFGSIFLYNWYTNKDKKENYQNFEKYTSSNDLKSNLSNIFKNNGLDLNEYPNVRVSADANFFKENKFLPECCMYYSDYSGDKGCPCITPEQQFYLQRRGGNRNVNSFINGEKSANLYFSPTNALLNRREHMFDDFSDKPKNVTPQDEEERKKILFQHFNLQAR